MRRFVQIAAIVGLSTVQVVGMSTSGVASTSQHAAQRATSGNARTEKPKPKPKIAGGAQTISQSETKEEQLGAKALDLVKFDWQRMLPGWKIRFLPARKGFLAMTFREERRIDVYVRMDRGASGTAHDIGHELGHAVDVTYFGDATRDEVLQIRNLKATTPWWACDACTDLQTGAGDFAETFALIVAPKYKFYSELGQDPTSEMVQRVSDVAFSAMQAG